MHPPQAQGYDAAQQTISQCIIVNCLASDILISPRAHASHFPLSPPRIHPIAPAAAIPLPSAQIGPEPSARMSGTQQVMCPRSVALPRFSRTQPAKRSNFSYSECCRTGHRPPHVIHIHIALSHFSHGIIDVALLLPSCFHQGD